MKLRKIAVILSIALVCSAFAPMAAEVSYAEGKTGSFISHLFDFIKNIAKSKPDDKPANPNKPDKPGKPGDKPDVPGKPDNPGKPGDKPDNPNKPNKPDRKEIDRILNDTVEQLEALKTGCQSTLIATAYKFSLAQTTHEKTVLYKQGKEQFAVCVNSFNAIMTEAGGKLKAAGADVSELEPLQRAFNRIIAEGEKILDRIVS